MKFPNCEAIPEVDELKESSPLLLPAPTPVEVPLPPQSAHDPQLPRYWVSLLQCKGVGHCYCGDYCHRFYKLTRYLGFCVPLVLCTSHKIKPSKIVILF